MPASEDEMTKVDHPLDFPPIYTRPSAQKLVSTLRSLIVQASTFETDRAVEGSEDNGYHGNGLLADSIGVTSYLTSIVKSPLVWLEDEEAREQIWSLASMRLSERAGRTAMHSITRRFTIPRSCTAESKLGPDAPLEITLLEPSLTGDDLGHKTWCASYLLSRRLQDLQQSLRPSDSECSLRVLELGAGTGLLGLAFAGIFPNTSIDLTDLPSIVPNLAENVATNRHLLERVGSCASAFALDWVDAVPELDAERYDVVLAADPIYSPSHPSLLAKAVFANLLQSSRARLVIGLPMRDAYTTEVEDLRLRLEGMGLVLVQEGDEIGVDDWEGQAGNRTEVKCWWGVWKWQSM